MTSKHIIILQYHHNLYIVLVIYIVLYQKGEIKMNVIKTIISTLKFWEIPDVNYNNFQASPFAVVWAEKRDKGAEIDFSNLISA